MGENPELDIMDRVPRNSKRDHLVNTKLISFAYFQIGVIQASAGMYTYFLILNDFGVRPTGIWQMSELILPGPAATDRYTEQGNGTTTGPSSNATMDAYWDWKGGVKSTCGKGDAATAGSACQWAPASNTALTSLYGNSNISCPDDHEDENNKYVACVQTAASIKDKSCVHVSKNCLYKKVPLNGEAKKVVDYIWYKMAWDKVRNSRVDL